MIIRSMVRCINMEKISFKSSFDVDDISLDCSSTKSCDYKLCVNEKGHEYLSKVGEHDFQEEIDSYLPDTDINMLIARFVRGDTSAIGDPSEMSFGDSTDFDVSLNELNDRLSSLGQSVASDKDFQVYLSTDPKVSSVDDLVDGYLKFVSKKKKKDVNVEKDSDVVDKEVGE